MRALYERDETVWYTRLGSRVRIVNVVNESDPMDRRLQGYRYTVQALGKGRDILWSVPEDGLQELKTARSNINKLTG